MTVTIDGSTSRKYGIVGVRTALQGHPMSRLIHPE